MSDKLKHYKIHRFCALFPRPDAEQYARNKASIEAQKGLTDPVVMWCGEVVDGKTRLEICEETGVDPGAFREWKPSSKANTIEQMEDELWEWMKRKNIDRRHMTAAQIAAVLVDHENLMKRGNQPAPNRATGPIPVSASTIAKESKQSIDTVKRIVSVKKNADPKVFEAVKDGVASPRDAASVAHESPKVQRQAVKDVEAGKTKTLKESVTKHKPPIKKDNGADGFNAAQQGEWRAGYGKLVRMSSEWLRLNGGNTNPEARKMHAEYEDCLSLLIKLWIKANPKGRWF